MLSHQFVMAIMGDFNQDLLRSTIRIAEQKLSTMDIAESMKRKIFHFMVECAQSLCKTENSISNSEQSLFLISEQDHNYIVYLGCVISESETKNIMNAIDTVNKLENQQVIDRFYKELSTNGYIAQNALLVTLLDISKRTKDKINYEIKAIDNSSNFFCFKKSINNYNA